jgi:hypothetical protein
MFCTLKAKCHHSNHLRHTILGQVISPKRLVTYHFWTGCILPDGRQSPKNGTGWRGPLFFRQKTDPPKPRSRLLDLLRPVIGSERIGLHDGAGDEIRTRDSLLGRQVGTKTLSTCYQSALKADSLVLQSI